MGYTSRQLLQSCLGLSALPLYFLAPGYLAGFLTNFMQFRSMSIRYRLLWSLPLSTAFALILAVHPWLRLSPRATMIGFLIIGAGALAVFARDLRHRLKRPVMVPGARWYIAVLAALLLYCLLAPLSVQIGHRLYEHAASQTDWSIRIQLINACLRNGVAPASPMFAFHGHTVPLHTYFYWYVLCAQLALLTGIAAPSALTASCAGSALALVASMLLYLKYVPVSSRPMRWQAAALALAMSATGLEVLDVVFDLFRHRLRPDPQLGLFDHAPGFLYTFIWSPHHAAGIACCLTGLLLIFTATGKTWRTILAHGVLSAICFAAAAGTSTYVAGIFCLICLAVLIDSAVRGNRALILTMAVATLVSLLLTLPFARQMASSSNGSHVNKSAPVHFRLRYNLQASDIISYRVYYRKNLLPPKRPSLVSRAVRSVIMLAMLLTDMGFILFVAVLRFLRDWPRRRSLESSERLLWLIFVATALPCFYMSSANETHAANDLAFHAGTILRVVAAFWSVPLLLGYFERHRRGVALAGWPGRVQAIGVTALALGLVSQAVQILTNRFAMPLIDADVVPSLPVGQRVPQVGLRYFELREAMDAAGRNTPPNAIVQIYPHDRLDPALLLYTHRQMAASDDGCNLPFGGDEKECKAMVTQLNELFGGEPYYQGAERSPKRLRYNPVKTTAENFFRVCQENDLAAIVADYTSPAWQRPGTWIWTLHPVYANSTARVFLCPHEPNEALTSPTL